MQRRSWVIGVAFEHVPRFYLLSYSIAEPRTIHPRVNSSLVILSILRKITAISAQIVYGSYHALQPLMALGIAMHPDTPLFDASLSHWLSPARDGRYLCHLRGQEKSITFGKFPAASVGKSLKLRMTDG